MLLADNIVIGEFPRISHTGKTQPYVLATGC